MNISEIPYTERELIKRAIKAARPKHGNPPKQRWALVRNVFSTGRTVARAICWNYGFDPDKEVRALQELPNHDYKENCLTHGFETWPKR